MRFLIISQYFWPENFRINDVALGLQERGHSVTVLTGIPNYPEGKYYQGYSLWKLRAEDYHGIRVIRVPIVPRGKAGILRLVLNYVSFTISSSILAPFLCRGKFDRIIFSLSPITEGVPSIVMKLIKRVPLIYWVQDLWPDSLSATGAVRSLRLLSVVKTIIRFIYRRCNLILVQSQGFIPSVRALAGENCNIAYLPNSAEDLYRPADAIGATIKPVALPGGFCLMFAGNIGAAQDFPTILGAAERLKEHQDIHWVIVGDGRMKSWVEEQMVSRGLSRNVHLLGRYPAESMPGFYASADVLLVTLRKEHIFALTIPSKVQSYLACAKPIIAALEGEGSRIIDDAGAGVSCPAENPGALAKAVLYMYHLPNGERSAMGSRGRKYFEQHFERTKLLERLETLLSDIQKEKPTCAY